MADIRGCDDPSLPKPRKSTFKITSITKPTRGGSGEIQADADGDVDSMDDLDESHTEDFSSEVLDSSKATDIDQDVVLTPEEIFTKDNRPADPQSRFKVVKIETKEPFRRGRWLCHDFLDTLPAAEKTEVKPPEEIHVHSGTSSASSSIHYVHGVDDPSRNPLAAGAVGTVQHLADSRPGNYSPKPGETFKPIHPAPAASQASAMTVTPIPPQRQTPNVDTNVQNPNPNITQSQQIGSAIQQGNHQKQSAMHIPVVSHTGMHTVPQTQVSVATSMPQNTVITTNVQPNHHSVHGAPGSVMNTQSSHDAHASQPTNFPGRAASSVSEPIPPVQGGPALVQQVPQNAQPRYGQVSQPGTHSINTSTVPQQPIQNHISAGDTQLETNAHPAGTDPGQSSQISMGMSHGQENNQSNELTESGTDYGPQTLLSPLAAAVGSMTNQQADEIKDDSGSSTVAIDNKIEQAMDLVKSHLMFAVREEVEVLKEQIKDMMEKIAQLEYENGVLKASATQETLSKLNLPKPQPPSSSSS